MDGQHRLYEGLGQVLGRLVWKWLVQVCSSSVLVVAYNWALACIQVLEEHMLALEEHKMALVEHMRVF